MKIAEGWPQDLQVQRAIHSILSEKLKQGQKLQVTAVTASMRYLIQPGATLEVVHVDPHKLKRGDIVAVLTGYGYRIHRIHSISRGEIPRFVTRGDFKVETDFPFGSAEILGKATNVQWRGGTLCLDQTKGWLLGWFIGKTSRFSVQIFRLRSQFLNLRDFVIRTAHLPLLGRVYVALYHLAIRHFSLLVLREPNILSVFLRRGLAGSGWLPGRSDIDLAVILSKDSTQTLQNLEQRHRRLKKIYPFLGELWLGSLDDFRLWTQFSSRGFEVLGWRLIGGEDCRDVEYVVDDMKLRKDLILELLVGFQILSMPLCRLFSYTSLSTTHWYQIEKGCLEILRVCYFLPRVTASSTKTLSGGREAFLAEASADQSVAAIHRLIAKAKLLPKLPALEKGAVFWSLFIELSRLSASEVNRLGLGRSLAVGEPFCELSFRYSMDLEKRDCFLVFSVAQTAAALRAELQAGRQRVDPRSQIVFLPGPVYEALASISRIGNPQPSKSLDTPLMAKGRLAERLLTINLAMAGTKGLDLNSPQWVSALADCGLELSLVTGLSPELAAVKTYVRSALNA